MLCFQADLQHWQSEIDGNGIIDAEHVAALDHEHWYDPDIGWPDWLSFVKLKACIM